VKEKFTSYGYGPERACLTSKLIVSLGYLFSFFPFFPFLPSAWADDACKPR